MSLTYKELFPKRENFLVSGGDLIATVVYAAIKYKTWPTVPRKLDLIVHHVTALYKKEFTRVSADFYYKEFATYDELHDWLKENLLAIPEIEELNLSQKEYEAGIQVNDEGRDKYVFTDRYSPAPPIDEDFIDLDAFVRNVCHDLIRSCVEVDFSTFPEGPYHEVVKNESD